MDGDTPPDVVDYLTRPMGERLADAWPDDPTEEEELAREYDRLGVHLDETDDYDLLLGDDE